jgi:hypothetical protein
MVAVRAIVFGLTFSQRFEELKPLLTDFTHQLRTFLPIIEVDILVRGVAVRTDYLRWNHRFFRNAINRLKRFVVCFLVFFEDYLIILFRFFFTPGGCGSGSRGSGRKSLKWGNSSLNWSLVFKSAFGFLRIEDNSMTIFSISSRLNFLQIQTTNLDMLDKPMVVSFFFLRYKYNPKKRGRQDLNKKNLEYRGFTTI